MASRQKIVPLILVIVFVAGSGKAYPGGIGGDANNQGDVSLAGCTCHAEDPDNSVTVILDGVPFHYGTGHAVLAGRAAKAAGRICRARPRPPGRKCGAASPSF